MTNVIFVTGVPLVVTVVWGVARKITPVYTVKVSMVFRPMKILVNMFFFFVSFSNHLLLLLGVEFP